MALNKILTFCASGIENTDYLSDADYSADSQRGNGNQPGTARAELVNKVLRQASLLAAGLSQFMADNQAVDIVDSLTPAQIASYFEDAINAFVPIDVIDVIYVPYTSPPTGYLKANGAAISRTTYANLFSKIGTTFGIGDGTSTFNLPDLRGEFIRCLDDGRGIDPARGLGTYQRGTLEQRDLDGISGLSQHSGPSPAQPDTNRDSIGLDAPVLSDYPGDPFCNVAGPTGVNFTLSANTSHFGVMRPRNIALLACIKY